MTLTPPPRPALLVLLALALAAGGCGSELDGSPTAPSPATSPRSEANDIALQSCFVMDYVGFDVDGAGSTLSARLAHPADRGWACSRCARCGTPRSRWADSPSRSRGVSTTQAGDEVTVFGPAVTRMNWRSHVWGAVATSRDTATVMHHSDYDFTGLQEADSLVIVNGQCADTLLNRFHSRGQPADALRLLAQLARRRQRRDAQGRRTAGERHHHRHRAGGRAEQRRAGRRGKHLVAIVVITFNGTSQPDMVVNGTYHYKWLMDEGTVLPV